MGNMELLITIVLDLLISLGLLSVYEAQHGKKPNPTIIELFLFSVLLLLFAFLGIENLAYFWAIVFAIFFVWLFGNKYVEAINEGRKKNEDKSPLGAIKYRWKKILSPRKYLTFKISIIIVLILITLGIILKISPR